MVAILLPNGEQTFLDSDGNPLAGGSVGMYIPTTLTPKDTWQDSAHTILNTNPILLDAAGRAIIYGIGIYRQIVKDVFGQLQWDQLTTGGDGGGAGGATQNVGTIAALRALDIGSASSGGTVGVLGYLAAGDEAGYRIFEQTTTSPGPDNGGTIIWSDTPDWYYRMLFSGPVQAVWFGAVTGGNFVSACRAAIAAAIALGGAITVPLISASRPVVDLPEGEFAVPSTLSDDTVQNLNGLIIRGQNTILNLSGGITGFGGVGYDVTFRDLQFLNGATAVSIKTANADSSIISFENCQFLNQTTASVQTDANSNSTKIVFDDECKFYNQNTGANLVKALTGDQVIVRGWVETECDVSFDITDAVLFLDRILGVPLNGGGFWAQLRGVGSFWASECRFGAESGGKTVLNVLTTAAPGYIILRDNAIFCVGPWIVLGALPKFALVCKGSNAPENTQGIALTNLNTAQKTFLFNQSTGFVDIDPWMTPLSGNQEIANLLFPSYARDIIQSDLLLTIPINSSSFGLSNGSNHVTVTNVTDVFGNFAYSIFGNNAANDGFWSQNYSTALASIGGYTGPITMIVDVENVTPPFPVVANVTVGYVEKLIPVMAGKHFLTIHGYADGTNMPASIAFFNLLDGVTVKTSGIRLIKGHVNPAQEAGTWLSVSGTGAPAGGTWMIGDRNREIPPVSGQPVAESCVTAGTPGTWKVEATYS